MAKRRLPELDSTGRNYLTDTRNVRLGSPGIERYAVERSRTARNVVVAAVLVAALVGAFLLLSR